MLKESTTPLLMLYVVLSLALPSQAQSHASKHTPKPVSDACPGPWHQAGYEGFKVGMRVPGGMNCLLRSPGLRDEYKRKTPTNEYAIRPSYANDYTESRLHPATVLKEVIFLPDQPKPLAQILADLGEARQLCKDGCRIVGLQSSADYRRPWFAVFPKNPTEEQRAWALRVTSDELLTDRPENPVPVAYLYLEKQQRWCTHFDQASLGWPIVRMTFSVADTSFPRQKPIRSKSLDCFEPGLTDLGEFVR